MAALDQASKTRRARTGAIEAPAFDRAPSTGPRILRAEPAR
jgi:hypothetical protein